ncbi:MAG: hypothetical protein BGO55_06255 [Sphingobacteriales bacterium 50-39]|nr:hypothetical protein [Sphingobacteriales bacterium]OJW52865.1 MAG: hypothetical protein BGO55_06255 [Sphingobacteriales bacterium 50-39]
MAKDNKITEQQHATKKGIPFLTYSFLENKQSPSGREYAKEFLRWAGKSLRQGGKQFRALYIRLATRIPEQGYNGINTAELDRRMRKINWNKDYYSEEALAKGERSPRMQRRIMRANSIFRDLKKLSDSGHYMAEEIRWKLQHKYWTNTRMQPQTGNTLEAVALPASYRSVRNIADARENSEDQVSGGISRDNRQDTFQKQQQNEARRKQIVKAGANLLTSLVSRQHKKKKGLGI